MAGALAARACEQRAEALQRRRLAIVAPEPGELGVVGLERRGERLDRERERLVGERHPAGRRERPSASRAAAHGEPLTSALPSFGSSPRSRPMRSKRCPSARISPEPPLPWDGTRGSSAPSSMPATASATCGRTAPWPSTRFASRREDDPARHALGQRLAERDAAIARLQRLLRPLLCREAQRRAVAEAARDAVDRRALVLEQGQERGPCGGDARRDGRLEGDGLALPGDAPERGQREVVAAAEGHGHAGESTEAMSFGASAGLRFGDVETWRGDRCRRRWYWWERARAASCWRATPIAARGACAGPYCEGWPVYHAVHDADSGRDLRRRRERVARRRRLAQRRPRRDLGALERGAGLRRRQRAQALEGLGPDARRTAACSPAARAAACSRAATARGRGRC